ncbi:MAG: hypothetical protein R3195_07940 [Gemmatimonadota bacterium]|nr:hypothetical protein [Gemmatimonadota bacterium]
MNRATPPPPDSFRPILERYSRGEVSAYDAACDIQDLGEPGFDDPSASEVILWTRMIGLGPPVPDEAEARAEADRILRRMSDDTPVG